MSIDADDPKEAPFENLEQSQETAETPGVVSEGEAADVERLTADLIARLRELDDGDQIAEIVESATKLLRDKTNRGDLKLINKSVKEIRYALKVFAPYREVRKVSIFGSARTPEADPDYKQAEAFGRAMAAAGWMVITGAGGGIMAAGHGGAGSDPSFGLAIRLPFEQATNKFIARDKKLVNFKYFFTRKLMFVRSSHGIALFPGGFGTMDEGFEVLTLVQTGKAVPMPIVYVDQPGGTYWKGWMDYVERELLGRGFISETDLRLFKLTDSPEVATQEMLHFYNNYHSIRFAREGLIMRLQRAPGSGELAAINRDFADILMSGAYAVTSALPIEADEPALAKLPRLVFNFNKRDNARLRVLIDRLNDL